MSEITRLLDAAASGDQMAAAAILPLVYDELRRLAAIQMVNEPAGHTLDATALVHEAYMRLAGRSDQPNWEHRRHFVVAAAEAMRRILVDHARGKSAKKRGGKCRPRVDLANLSLAMPDSMEEWVAVNDALEQLAAEDPGAAELARLKVLAGTSVEEAGDILGISRATAYRDWTYARAWLRNAIGLGDTPHAPHDGEKPSES
jgi:RNA polymerase sigma factor (TIGR02999 family)